MVIFINTHGKHVRNSAPEAYISRRAYLRASRGKFFERWVGQRKVKLLTNEFLSPR